MRSYFHVELLGGRTVWRCWKTSQKANAPSIPPIFLAANEKNNVQDTHRSRLVEVKVSLSVATFLSYNFEQSKDVI